MNGSTSRTPERSTADERRVAETPTDLPRGAWREVVKRTLREYKADGLGDLAAALTYYAVLAIFPMLIVLVSLLGLLGQSVTQPLVDNLAKVAPGAARQIFTSAVHNIQANQGTAGVLFVVGLAGALWSASGYIAAFMRASNVIWDVEEGRPIWKTIPLRLGVTLLTVSAPDVLGVGGGVHRRSRQTAWQGDRGWIDGCNRLGYREVAGAADHRRRDPGDPVLHSTERTPARFPMGDPWRCACSILWVVASAAFALYVANFSSYNKTYGALASVIVFLVWLWITNLVILFGAELNAEIERGRQIQAGQPEDEEPFLPLRSEPNRT